MLILALRDTCGLHIHVCVCSGCWSRESTAILQPERRGSWIRHHQGKTLHQHNVLKKQRSLDCFLVCVCVSQPGVRTHYVEMGSGPPVLLCHGFPESWYSWRYQVSLGANVKKAENTNNNLYLKYKLEVSSGRSRRWQKQVSGF